MSMMMFIFVEYYMTFWLFKYSVYKLLFLKMLMIYNFTYIHFFEIYLNLVLIILSND